MSNLLHLLRYARRRCGLSALGCAVAGALSFALPVHAAPIDISGPSGSVAFGTSVTALSNGNFVVTDPDFDASGIGAVYLYNSNRKLISTLTGSSTGDHVGSGGVVAVGNSNFVVVSPEWSNVDAPGAGAVTWINGSTGLAGVVSVSNSLVGTTEGDEVGGNDDEVVGVFVLSNGNYVVASPFWNNGVAGSNVGAATWGNGNAGIAGAVSETNSLIGTTTGDNVAGYVGGNTNANLGVLILNNGNYVVESPLWNNGVPGSNVGAATWGNGSSGITGPVSASNSLAGTTAGDRVGTGRGSAALTNGTT